MYVSCLTTHVEIMQEWFTSQIFNTKFPFNVYLIKDKKMLKVMSLFSTYMRYTWTYHGRKLSPDQLSGRNIQPNLKSANENFEWNSSRVRLDSIDNVNLTFFFQKKVIPFMLIYFLTIYQFLIQKNADNCCAD